MVGVESESSSLDEVTEVADALKGPQQLLVVRGPQLLVFLEFGRVEGQWLPPERSPLLEYPANCEV